MDVELNVTYLVFGGHVEVHKYGFLYFLIMFIVYILILCSNSTIVCVIWIHKKLHEPMYIFIAALLVNSVLFSTVIYPKLLIDFLSEEQIISLTACICQCFLFYSLGGAEFLLLTAMAYDRYVSICKPLKYSTIMSKTTVIVLLALAWLVPSTQVAASLILESRSKVCRSTLSGIFCNVSISGLFCELSKFVTVKDLIMLLNIALLPGLFILFTYSRILIISYKSGREVRKKAAQTCLPHLIILVNYTCLCVFDVIIVGHESDLPKTVRFIMTLQMVLYHPLLNPIIYGLKMKEITKHLKRLFCPDKLK
ncbi:olfactory receptor 13C2-like [Notolabrus celidotus]|uniref:olfactory receptor 13C2-like n=1 Tax=Notolabrus celidotus TaxID=1203425 RepID=UPI00148FF8FB|nr:olfactory receptor 13C2-like [Notolabrus celidotus]